MKGANNYYDALRAEIDDIPVIDCHEHVVARRQTTDILNFIGTWYFTEEGPHYFGHDLISAVGEADAAPAFDTSRPIEERWPAFERAYRAARFTGYGRALRYGLEHVFGSSDVSLEALRDWATRIPDYSDPDTFEKPIHDAGVAARVSDNWPPIREIVSGTYEALPGQYLAIALPQFHQLLREEQIDAKGAAVGTRITSLGEYLEVCRRIFERWREMGAVCFKDQSAYERSLAYSVPTRAEAEQLFNTMLANPRASLAWHTDGHVLSDFLMHEFMRMARDLELPVQLHTGHMAGSYNEVAKANASHLRTLIELHKDVHFDLFHANWPYSGDALFLAKNYPNVAIDFCWAHQVDPIYSARMLEQSVATVPFTKIHGVGSDVDGRQPHMIWAHVKLARDVIATALSELIAKDFIDREGALEIAKGWLYENARSFFKLPVKPL
jgi:hypothetical protein